MEMKNYVAQRMSDILKFREKAIESWPRYIPPPKDELVYLGNKNHDLILLAIEEDDILGLVYADLRREFDRTVLSLYDPICDDERILEQIVNELLSRTRSDIDSIVFGVHPEYGLSSKLPDIMENSEFIFDICRVYVDVNEQTLDQFEQYKELKDYSYKTEEKNLGNLFKRYFRWSDRMLNLHLSGYQQLDTTHVIHRFLKENGKLTGRMFLNAEDRLGKGAILVAGRDQIKDFESMMHEMLEFALDKNLVKVGFPISGIQRGTLVDYPLDVFHSIRYYEKIL